MHCRFLFVRRLDILQCGNADDASVFDRIRGEDSWLGRKVIKKFWVGKGKKRHQVSFAGKVTDIDEDEQNAGHRLFEVKWSSNSAWLRTVLRKMSELSTIVAFYFAHIPRSSSRQKRTI